jgi:hypothetical protein
MNVLVSTSKYSMQRSFTTIVLPSHSLHGVEPFIRSRQSSRCSRTSQLFMEPNGSLPCSQEPSTGPYTAPSCLTKFHFIVILSSHLHLVVLVVSSWLSNQNPICIPVLIHHHTHYMPFPFHHP